jgi:PAS domain S-box-containing protein
MSTIRFRILALVAAAMAPLVIGIAGELYSRIDRDREHAGRLALIEANRVAAELDEFIGTTRGLLAGVAVGLSSDVSHELRNDAVLSAAKARASPVISNFLLFDLDGRLLGAPLSDPVERARLFAGDRTYFQKILGGERFSVGEAVLGRSSGRWLVTVAVPVNDAEGRLRAVLAAGILIERIHEILRPSDLPSGTVIRVADEQGIVIGRSVDREKWMARDLSQSTLFQKHMLVDEAVEELTWSDDIPRMTGSVHLKSVPWLVSVGIPPEHAYAEARERFWWGVGAALLTICGVSFLAWVLSGWIARPLRQLAMDASALAEGRLRTRFAVSSNGELGRLARAFNAMADTLQLRIIDSESAREELRESNEFLAAVIDASPVAIVCVGYDRRVLFWSGAAERIFGYTAAETVGQPYKLVPQGGEAEFDALFARALAGEMLRDMEVVRRRKDGSTVPIRFAGAALHDRQGNVRGVAYALEDISARRQLDAARSMKERIFETSLDLLLVTDRRGTFSQVSPSSATILGYRPEEMIGRSGIEFIHPDDLDSTREEMRAARKGGRIRDFESRYLHRDGRTIALVWTGVWSEPEQSHFFIGRDMTERRTLEQQLFQAQKMEALGQLTGGLSHDFNNLLGIVIGNLDLLQAEIAGDAEKSELLNEAIEAALRGADLNKRLLAFARRQPLQPKRLEPNELVLGMMKLFKRAIGEHVEIEFVPGEDVWPITVDPAQLESALTNLAVNARDAMPKGGRLIFATGNGELDADYAAQHAEILPGEYVVIEVTDTGAGMTPDVLRRVFEPFFTTKETGKGTGLGLSMVFGFMKQSGGHIQIYSEPGRGTTVRLYLPRAQQQGSDAGTGSIGQRTLPQGEEKVLVVEDNDQLRRVLVRQLSDLGYTVQEASNGTRALDVLRSEQRYDLLITDVIMPGGVNGWELASAAADLRPELRVLFTSGFPAVALSEQGLPEGVLLLSKPYRRQDLAEKVRAALAA